MMAAVVLAEQLHEAADIVGAADSSGLRQFGVAEQSVVQFVEGTAWEGEDTGDPMNVDPLSLAMGITIGIVARARLGGA